MVMYWCLGVSMVFLFMLSYPATDYVIQGKDGPIRFSTEMGKWPFVITLFALGIFMSLVQAAVFKHLPVYDPNNVGAVGGLVGMIGGLGGFILPLMFGALLDLTGIYTSCFALLFVLVAIALAWMHLSVRAMERAAHGEALDRLPSLPEMQEIHDPAVTTPPSRSCRACCKTGGPRMRRSGPTPAAPLHGATCGCQFRHCCFGSRSGWCGRW